jgi:hypothetical protein
MSYEAISANESLRAFAEDRSGSSSSYAAAAEDQGGKKPRLEDQKQSSDSLLGSIPATNIAMPQRPENKSKIFKLFEEESGENKGR